MILVVPICSQIIRSLYPHRSAQPSSVLLIHSVVIDEIFEIIYDTDIQARRPLTLIIADCFSQLLIELIDAESVLVG